MELDLGGPILGRTHVRRCLRNALTDGKVSLQRSQVQGLGAGGVFEQLIELLPDAGVLTGELFRGVC